MSTTIDAPLTVIAPHGWRDRHALPVGCPTCRRVNNLTAWQLPTVRSVTCWACRTRFTVRIETR